MQIAYLILAHKNPNQLKRLVKTLSSQDVSVFIHLDNKTINVSDYAQIATEIKDVHFITERVTVTWGAYSMIQATLNGLQQIIDSGTRFDYINLLSGLDYPIKSNKAIFEFFSQNYGHEFLYYDPFPTKDLPGGGLNRIECYYDTDNPNSDIEVRLKGVKRKFIEGMKPYHGSQWWSLTWNCVKYILDLVKSNNEILDFYRYTKFPDEHFFQTMIMNSSFAEKAVNNSLRYIDWSPVNWVYIDWVKCVPHPKTLTIYDYLPLVNSPALFARKFDESVDNTILYVIDSILQQ